MHVAEGISPLSPLDLALSPYISLYLPISPSLRGVAVHVAEDESGGRARRGQVGDGAHEHLVRVGLGMGRMST